MPPLTREEIIAAYQETVARLSEGNALADVLSDMLDCSYYEKGNISKWTIAPCDSSTPMQWVRFEQLPTGESEDLSYRPKERMQCLLNTLRGISDKTAFVLIRKDGYTHLYMGVFSQNLGTEAASQLQILTELNLTGATVSQVPKIPNRNYTEVESDLNSMDSCGILTGQPSIRRDMNENPLQTLDKLTASFRSDMDVKKKYAVLILAEPVADGKVKDIINRVLHLKSDLQEYRKYTNGIALAQTSGKTSAHGFGIGGGMAEIGELGEKLLNSGIKGLASLGLTAAVLSTGMGAAGLPFISDIHNAAEKILTNVIGLGIHGFHSNTSSHQMTQNQTVSVERVNHSVEYCMGLLDKLIVRLQDGRNQGFWNVGTYILAKNAADVGLVASILRSIYAGKDTYQEPLRIFNFGTVNTQKSKVNGIVKEYAHSMSLLPLPADSQMKNIANQFSGGESWHILGKLYESLTTPLNTEELSIMMSLPHRDFAGLSIRKDAVEFSTNPPPSENVRTIELGTILDMGAPTGHKFSLNIDRLNGHGLIVGKSGSGKTVTGRDILHGMIKHKVPFLVIDPIKTDYLYWADSYNRKHRHESDFKPIALYAPGIDELPGLETPIEKLQMNPFQPYAAKGAKINIMNHTTQLLSILRRNMAMGNFLPMLLDEAIRNYIAAVMGEKAAESNKLDPDKVKKYPTFSGLNVQVNELLKQRKYSEENTRNFMAAVETRINNLTNGWKGDFFETQQSTPADKLFERNVVISLEGVGDDNDKSFFMALFVQALYEYRASRYKFDLKYRKRVEEGREKFNGNFLTHYTILEEAHSIISAPRPGISPEFDPQGVIAEKFYRMLSEIRETGEGIMIVDQYPSRLIVDAVKNTDVKLIHNLQADDDRRAMAGCIGLNQKQSNLLATLKKGQAVIGQDDSAIWLKIIHNRD